MKILIFLNRIALICNICFVIAEIMRYTQGLNQHPVLATVILLGYASLLLNTIIAIAFIIIYLTHRNAVKPFPRWLIITNFLFLTAQLFIFLS